MTMAAADDPGVDDSPGGPMTMATSGDPGVDDSPDGPMAIAAADDPGVDDSPGGPMTMATSGDPGVDDSPGGPMTMATSGASGVGDSPGGPMTMATSGDSGVGDSPRGPVVMGASAGSGSGDGPAGPVAMGTSGGSAGGTSLGGPVAMGTSGGSAGGSGGGTIPASTMTLNTSAGNLLNLTTISPASSAAASNGTPAAGSPVVFVANSAPILSTLSIPDVWLEDTVVSLPVDATDRDGDQVSFTVSGGSSSTVLPTINGGELVLTPAQDFNTDIPIDITVTASDGRGGTSAQTLSIVVQAVNDAPILSSMSIPNVWPEDTVVSLPVNATDVDGDQVSFTVSGGSSSTVLPTINGGELVLTPAQDFNTDIPMDITVTASDGRGGTSAQTLSIVVDPVNDAPVSSNNSVSTNGRCPYLC